MRIKNLLLFTLALGLIALAVILGQREKPAAGDAPQPLVAASVLETLTTLTVKAGNKTSTIRKGSDGNWVVQEKFGLPADLENRLTPLLRALQKANNHGLLTSNPQRLERLNLTDSSVQLTPTQGPAVLIEFGKSTEDGLGSSARLGGETRAIRTDFGGNLEGDPVNWVDFTLFKRTPGEIRALSFVWADGKATFARPELGAPFKGAEGGAIDELANSVAAFRAGDAVAKTDPEALAAFAQSWQLIIDFFDKTAVTVTFARVAGKTPNDQPKYLARVGHSDPRHPLNALSQKVDFVAAAWIAEQVPATYAAFKKAQQPPGPGEETPTPPIQIPGPPPTIIKGANVK